VIKMVLAMHHGLLPQTMHIDQPSSKVDWSTGAVELLTQARDWPDHGRPRRAGVSSFGVSGTNAHVILEQAPQPPPDTPDQHPDQHPEADSDTQPPGLLPVVISARSEQALLAHAAQLASWISTRHDQTPLSDLARSLLETRSTWEHRGVVLAGDHTQAREGLQALAVGRPVPGVITGTSPATGGLGKTVWMFPGQGAQWTGMGRQLWATEPVFAARMTQCEQALAPYVDWSLADVINGVEDPTAWERVDVLQPVSFAVMVSLAALWQSCGVHPDAVLGHSQGEIAAACVTGVLSLADAARVVTLRSKAIATGLAGHGGMLSVALPEHQIQQHIQAWDGRIEIAAINGPALVVIAGDPEALTQIQAEYEAQDVG
jgi:rifamycin polyketide synthase module 9/10